MLRIEAGPRTLRRLPDGVGSEPYERFTVVPLTPMIGAEIAGVDLRDPLDEESFAELRRALLEWKVLFFRDQAITGEQHRDFARRWGELEIHPFLPEGDVPEIARFDRGTENQGYENIWHTDVSWREVPSLGSVLRSIEVPAGRRRHALRRHGVRVRRPPRRDEGAHRRPRRGARLGALVRARDGRRLASPRCVSSSPPSSTRSCARTRRTAARSSTSTRSS